MILSDSKLWVIILSVKKKKNTNKEPLSGSHVFPGTFYHNIHWHKHIAVSNPADHLHICQLSCFQIYWGTVCFKTSSEWCADFTRHRWAPLGWWAAGASTEPTLPPTALEILKVVEKQTETALKREKTRQRRLLNMLLMQSRFGDSGFVVEMHVKKKKN